MTRVLAELLGAEQPHFGTTLRQLENAAGMPNTDIKLSTEIANLVRAKLHELGLDPQDTNAAELYQALKERFGKDEASVRDALKIDASAAVSDVLAAIQHFATQGIEGEQSFALKASVAKRLLKKVPPKKAMKSLNYRSVDSMLKHEPVAYIYTASLFTESLAWRKKFLDQYVQLSPSDFEVRNIEVMIPTAGRWKKLAESSTAEYKHNVFALKELGVVVVLPLEKDLQGLAITSILLILNACNEVMSTGSYLKLQQVKPDFGTVARRAAEQELLTDVTFMSQTVPWRVIHQFYARNTDAYNPVIFEPHIYESDLKWRTPEKLLAELHPHLSFWEDTSFISLLKDKQHVSLNLLDVAVNFCNNLPYANRVSNFGRQHLWQELMMRYLNRENVELTLGKELQPEYVALDT